VVDGKYHFPIPFEKKNVTHSTVVISQYTHKVSNSPYANSLMHRAHELKDNNKTSKYMLYIRAHSFNREDESIT
jgi:hypothetical protein